ncbi:HipA family kinase [Dermacoccaceae bacterium W4C1]
MSLQSASAVRFVAPLREGGSLPGIMEADDEGTWVVKFRGAGQGLKVLVAEVIVGELARRVGLRVPELKVIDLHADLARYEADEEVQDLLQASVGENLGLDLLPGALSYGGGGSAEPQEAADIMWLDAFTANVDRTDHNPNLLRWHGNTWLIDHGAALYFHHGWPTKEPNPARFAAQPFDASTHVLRQVAGDLDAAHARMSERIDEALVTEVVAQVPGTWLQTTPFLTDEQAVRAAYVEHLMARLAGSDAWRPRS